MASVLILHPCVKVIMHKGKDGLVMEVREIYKISDMIHKAAGWKKENKNYRAFILEAIL